MQPPAPERMFDWARERMRVLTAESPDGGAARIPGR